MESVISASRHDITRLGSPLAKGRVPGDQPSASSSERTSNLRDTIVWYVAQALAVFVGENEHNGFLPFRPVFQFLLVVFLLHPLIGPIADMMGVLALHILTDDLVFDAKVIHNVPQILHPVSIQVKCVEIHPQIIPTLRLNHGLHMLPVSLTQRIALGLHLIFAPEMDLPLRQKVLQRASRLVSSFCGEQAASIGWRVYVEASG